MRTTILLLAVLLLTSVSLFGKDSKRIPNKEARKWHNELHNSPYKVYENFDGCMLHYDSIKNYITEKVHVKFIMGCSNITQKPDFRMYMIFIIGDEIEGGYINDYKTIRYFDGKNWIPSKEEEMDIWTTNWEKYLENNKLPYIRAFVVPNEDVLEVSKDKIYLSFGLEKIASQDSVKLLLSNKKYKPRGTESSNQPEFEDPIYMDACMPCPKVCGSDGR